MNVSAAADPEIRTADVPGGTGSSVALAVMWNKPLITSSAEAVRAPAAVIGLEPVVEMPSAWLVVIEPNPVTIDPLSNDPTVFKLTS